MFRSVALLVVCLLPLGCGGMKSQPNILLVTLDAARADHFSAYGYSRKTSPHLEKLAADGVIFKDAYSQSDWTLASTASLLTGHHPGKHGAVNPLWAVRRDVPTLAETLRAKGYTTAAFAVSYFHDPRHGFGRGFQTYENPDPAKMEAASLTARATKWLASNTSRPYFLWVHYYDPQAPYVPREPYYKKFHPAPYSGRFDFSGSFDPNTVIAPGVPLDAAALEQLVALYDSEIAAADAAIGTLLSATDLSNTLVVVTADHGEELKEHGALGHGSNLNRELLHVPLVIAGPGIPGNTVVHRTAQHVDVAPTLLELVDIDPPAPLGGRSLVGHLHGARADGSAQAFAEQMESSGEYSLYSLVQQPWHMIAQYGRHDGKTLDVRLYDISRDPKEQHNLWRPDDSTHAALKKSLDAHVQSMGGPGPPRPLVAPADPERMKTLRSLGFLREG